ncbi:hypothetical protein CDAR_183731 [Caerostris darwini]|uniref:Uncharacterized protein n=1 Tax=Caerostris darwini TaxID=1538125 RepID=A0AAV4Q6D5_9ARAC|nr:hypothetical protein CDAR_183731 [Caerostris darwini]
MAKCLHVVFKKQYADFFMANGGLIGMRKYFDEIKREDLRSFIARHANAEIPTFEDVFEIVKEFDKYDFMDFDIGDSELEYLYDYYYPDEDKQTIGDNLKLQESPVTLNMEDENKTIVCLMYKLGITSEQEVNRALMKCSFCGENAVNI